MGCCSSADEKARRQRPGVHPAQEYAIRPTKIVKGADGVEREVEVSENGTAYSALNTEEASEIARLSRAESVSKLTAEPSSIMMTLRRKFIITRAMLQHGINEDVDQFNSEIQESIADMREKDRRRVREWLDSVHRALRGRAPSEFPPVNPKKDRSKSRGKSGAEGIMSSHPHTKPPSRGASPGAQNLDNLGPSAAIEAEFKPDNNNSINIGSGSSGQNQQKKFLPPSRGDNQSISTADSSNDQTSTGAAIISTPMTREGGGHQMSQQNNNSSSMNTGKPYSPMESADTASPMSNRVASGNSRINEDDSVRANADGEDNNGISHKRPTAQSLGHAK